MVEVSYPGVYIVEVPSGVHTITGVSTSIGAFFGRTAKGPINRAMRIQSRADFLRVFGGAHPCRRRLRPRSIASASGQLDCG